MRTNFNAAFLFVLAHECVFEQGHHGEYAHVICENVPGDRGGLTKFGIDQRSHPGVNIRALDFNGAREIYRMDYWGRCRCDELPAGYDIAVFDTAVNCGCGTAALLLQRALNRAGAALKEDGFIGPRTLRIAEESGARGMEWFIELREERYRAIADNNASQHKFLNGWLDRVKDLQGEIVSALETKGVLAA